MSNWRLIEAELEQALLEQQRRPYIDYYGDKIANGLNLSQLARDLADRLSPIARPVQIKAGAECKVSQS